MSRFTQYNKNDTYLENMNHAKEQKEKRFNDEREEIERDKLELDKIKNQLEIENQIEKQKKELLKKQQFEEYTNYLKRRNSELPENRNKLNIKLNEDERLIKKLNYNQQMDNLCLNPTKQKNDFPQEQFVNFSQAGRNYQRGYSHGYNILTNEIFSSPNSNRNNANININLNLNNNSTSINETDKYNQKIEYENQYKNISQQKEVEENPKKYENNNNNPNNNKEEDYLAYMEMLRQKEIEQNEQKNNLYNQKYIENNNDIPPEYNNDLMNLSNQPKQSYHNIQSSLNNKQIKNDISQINRPSSQDIEKRTPHHILDSSRNEYLLNKQKNMISNYDIYKGKNYFQTQYKPKEDENEPKYGKLEKQREYARFLEGQINSKRIYEETIRNLSKNSEPDRESIKNHNMMIFGGMNPYQKIKERNNKLSDIPKDPYSNKSYSSNSNSFLTSNPITNPNSYQYNHEKRRISGRLQNNGNIIIGK